MLEPTAEEIALGMLWDERHRAKFYRQYAQSVAYEADCAASVFDRMSLRSAANRWQQVASLHRRNVSTLARIIRAIRAEKKAPGFDSSTVHRTIQSEKQT